MILLTQLSKPWTDTILKYKNSWHLSQLIHQFTKLYISLYTAYPKESCWPCLAKSISMWKLTSMWGLCIPYVLESCFHLFICLLYAGTHPPRLLGPLNSWRENNWKVFPSLILLIMYNHPIVVWVFLSILSWSTFQLIFESSTRWASTFDFTWHLTNKV